MTAEAFLVRYPHVNVHLFESDPRDSCLWSRKYGMKEILKYFKGYLDFDAQCASRGLH